MPDSEKFFLNRAFPFTLFTNLTVHFAGVLVHYLFHKTT